LLRLCSEGHRGRKESPGQPEDPCDIDKWCLTFKTYGNDAGLNERTVDAICGHAGRTKGDDYRDITLKVRIETMAAFPRYRIDENARRGATTISSPQPVI
jgi:hypothetical protein